MPAYYSNSAVLFIAARYVKPTVYNAILVHHNTLLVPPKDFRGVTYVQTDKQMGHS